MQFSLKKQVRGADVLDGVGGLALLVKKVLDSPSLNMTLTHHAFFVREIHMSQGQMCQSDGWACFACKKGLVHLVFV